MQHLEALLLSRRRGGRMEPAALTSTPHSSHKLSRRRSIGKRHGLVGRHCSQAHFAEVQLGSLASARRKESRIDVQSRISAECASLLPPGTIGRSNTEKPHAFLSVACFGAVIPAVGGDCLKRNNFFFSTSISTQSYKWHSRLNSPSRFMWVACHGHSSDFLSDGFGPYPWDPSWTTSDNDALEWVQEDIVTLFTTDGLIQIGGSLVPHQLSAADRRQLCGKTPVRCRRFREEDYMDPKQGLCLGAMFDIVATNGLDLGRRFCVFGFCRSIEMLSDVVEDTVLEQGGEVVVAAKGNRGGLNEKLSMRVAVPLLWGIPPAVDTLNYAIRCGGGIVEKASCQWEFL